MLEHARNRPFTFAPVLGELQIFEDRELREHATAFGHVADT